MHLRRIGSVLSPVLLILGCDALSSAYGQGYQCGYQAADGYFACTRACNERVEERNEEIRVWEDACVGTVNDHFATQGPIDDADSRCSDQYSFQSELVVCDDVGQEPGTHPSGCDPFNEPVFGAVDSNYDCPSDTIDRGNKRCLCCENANAPTCALSGGFCRSDEGCCDGRCILEEQQDAGPDAGFTPPPRGACQ